MLPSISWDLNITTLVSLGGGGVGFWLLVLRVRDTLHDLQKKSEAHSISMAKLELQHNALEREVQRECVRKEDLNPVIDRLTDQITEQGKEIRETLKGINDHLLRIAGNGGLGKS